MNLAESHDDRLRVRLRSEHGIVVRFTIQYETRLGATWLPVVRYDSAHSVAHRDLLDRQGRQVDKMMLGDAGQFGLVATSAIADVKPNWREYRERFLRSAL